MLIWKLDLKRKAETVPEEVGSDSDSELDYHFVLVRFYATFMSNQTSWDLLLVDRGD
jgi:hypothetical protein